MLCHQKHQGKQNFRLHSPPEKKLQFLFLALLILSHTQSVLLLQPEHLQNHQEKKVLGQASGTGNKYASLISKARFRGSGHEVDNDDNPKEIGETQTRKIWIILTKQGPFSRGDPDEEDDDGDDRDDDDEENESKPPSIEGISIGLENKLNYDLLSRYGTTIYHGSRTVQHLCFYNNVFST